MRGRNRLLLRAAAVAMITSSTVMAAPRPNHEILQREFGGATREGPIDGPVSLVLDDATKAQGISASGAIGEAVVFSQPHDSGFGWFMKSDDTAGYGTWATQQIFANGFVPGDSISAYDTLFFHSTFDDPAIGDATVMTELWDGDPFSIMDTVCTVGGVSAPIPGTQAIFSDIAGGTLVRLRVELPTKVQVDCERVWTVMTLLEGCRGTWRIAGNPGSMWSAPAQVGASNGIWLLYACEQFGVCDTANGYNAGRCCNAPELACDHTEGIFECDPFGNDPGGEPSFCGDGLADYFIADIDEPGVFKSYVSTVFAATDTVVSMVTVSVDAPPASGDSTGGVISLTPEEVVLSEGDHNVWLEFRIGDWDPDDIGVQLAAWQLTFDSSSYTTGAHGTLAPYGAGPFGGVCSGPGDDAPCVAILGPGAFCSFCGYATCPQTACTPVFVDHTRPDFVYANALIPIVTVDASQPDFRPAGTVIAGPPDDPEPFPEGGMYAATLVLHVPGDARGTFTIGLKHFPATQLVSQDSQFIPRLGIRSARITIQDGRCCFNLEDLFTGGEDCVQGLIASECANQPGITSFDPEKTCDDPCGGSCGDGAVNQLGEECDEGEGNSDLEPDACRTDCTLPICGDGVTDNSEQCDLANDQACPALCRSDCTCKVCGDDILDPGEACDDGPDNSDSIPNACRTDCTLPTCGDGVMDIGETCDGADDEACVGLCDIDCTCSICGNGIREPGEECDGVDLVACPGVCKPDCTCLSPIPTVSQWGLLVLTLSLLTTAKVYLGRLREGHRPR